VPPILIETSFAIHHHIIAALPPRQNGAGGNTEQ
jgi:hypothetical protein